MRKTHHAWYTVSASLSVILFELTMRVPDSAFLPYAIAYCIAEQFGIIHTMRIALETYKARRLFMQLLTERKKRKDGNRGK